VVEAVVIEDDRLAAALEMEVIGQHSSAVVLARAAALHLARVAPRRPLTVLALGPTGVGKTLMAETLAGAISRTTGTDCDYLRLDMAEFQERHTVSKLLGAPPGYVGFGEDPQLLRALRTGGRAVVLIDEIEKAHPDVFLALMNLMDAGRITPASGDTLDARHAILVFTTNLAVDVIRSILAQAENPEPVSRDTSVRAALRSHGVAPELVGRLHELLVFDDLGQEHLDALITRSIEREARTFGLEVLQVAPDVIEALRSRRPDPGSGARAWEHLICVDLGPAFLDARRRGVTGVVTINGDPVTVEPGTAGTETVGTNTTRSDTQ
jgi:ATP-dependent Clp protease ATP-binding subunit ClpA